MQLIRLLIVQLMIVMLACSHNTSTSPEVLDSSKEDNTFDAGYPIVDTGQTTCFTNTGSTSAPAKGNTFYGQDAQYEGNQPSYTDNGDGTVTDNVTGLMWQSGFVKADFNEAKSIAKDAATGGYTDWRVPTTKELYSLIDFTGNQGTGNPSSSTPPSDAVPFINTDYFEFEYPSENRYIDAQYIASTEYVATVMDGQAAFFGVNLADGRIKGYPQDGDQNTDDRWYLRLVRGNTTYGQNSFTDNGDGTITDNATALMWMQDDSGDDQFASLLKNFTNDDGSLNWEEALEFAENLEYAGYSDWRLPNAKELQSIVDYTRAPDATGSAAIDPLFNTSEIINEAGNDDYPFFWTSTSFEPGYDAIIVQFGRSLGYFHGTFMDVHGAGGQRTDPKTGEASYGRGPQGDVRRVYNYVRCVRDAS